MQADATIIQATHELFDRGCVLYADRKDKSWSLTDCWSFVVMQDQDLDSALTFDSISSCC